MRRSSFRRARKTTKGHWLKHKGKPAVHGFRARVGADADAALVEEVAITPANVTTTRRGRLLFPTILARLRRQRLSGTAFSRRRPCESGRPRIIATAMWGRDEQETLAGSMPEPANPSGAWSDRKDLRHMEALLWASSHAMARSLQGVHSGPSNRHRLQPQTNLEHHHRGDGVISAGTMANEPSPP